MITDSFIIRNMGRSDFFHSLSLTLENKHVSLSKDFAVSNSTTYFHVHVNKVGFFEPVLAQRGL